MASFPGQKGTGPPLPNQVGGVVATLTGGGSSLGPVQNVFLVMTGQTAVNQSVIVGSNYFFTPAAPNFNQITWDLLSGASSYQIWRETGRSNTWTQVGTATAPPFSDNTATNTCSGTPGSGPQFFTSTTYRYKVCGVDGSGNPGAFSQSYSAYLYRNGSYNPANPNGSTGFLNGDFGSAGTVDYQNATGAYPGGELCMLFSPTNDFPDWNYDVGTSTPQWSFWQGPFDSLEWDMKPLFTGANFTMGWYRRSSIAGGDQALVTPSGATTQYNVNDFNVDQPANVWTFGLTMPINILAQDAPTGTTIQQLMNYKNNVQLQQVNSGQKWYINNMKVTSVVS